VLIVDRVLCDCCGQPMGQLYSQPAPQADRLPDLRTAPDFTVCPDCLDLAEVVRDPSLAE
jgi:hypothetical protein